MGSLCGGARPVCACPSDTALYIYIFCSRVENYNPKNINNICCGKSIPMKIIWRYLKDYKKECVFAPLFKLLEAAFELFVPLVVAAVIDRGISTGDRPYIYRMFAILVVLSVIGLVCAITAQFYSAKAATGFAAKLRHALFSHIQSLSYADLDSFGTPKLITRISSDVTQMQTGVNLFLRLIMRAPFVVFGAMIMAFAVDVKGALVFCVTIPLLLAVAFGIIVGCLPLYKKVQSHLDAVTTATRENLTGVRVIRAFAKEQQQQEAFAEKNDALYAVQRFTGRISSLLNPVTYLIINAAIAVLIYTGALRVNLGALTQGEVVALYNYMAQILTELIKLANLVVTMTRAAASTSRVKEVFAAESSMENGSERALAGADVSFCNVSLTYRGDSAPSLSHITFTAQAGQTIGVIGATGSGKSTLVNLIPRFYDATEGEVRVGGKPVALYDMAVLRDEIGIVPQKAVLFKGTIRENLTRGLPGAAEADIEMALQIAQAADVVAKKPGGLDELIEQGGRNLSGGQRQRLTIARALVKKPRILILDDSSSALDYATDAALRQSIRSCPFGPTVFIVSQRASSVMHADQIIVLENGEMVGLGRHEELLESCPVYAEIYESQFEKREEA